MASAFTHAAAALALGTAFRNPGPPARFWLLGAAFAVVPDLDAVGYWMGVPYDSDFGHRGFSHSIFFAALLAGVGLMAFRGDSASRGQTWLFLFLATASHGVLDALTTGGGGVAFLAPFDNERYRFPWRPIVVSPMSIRRFFSERGVRVLASELLWIWIPATAFAVTAVTFRRRSKE
ncbi:MAG TPA: metal-dependent hydrolase [Gemmatimonadaceae bacterium]|nr:metal-dependent hydrolase [Gemmatimonadaceae bacterium]